jgi:K+-transporting ATPase ATPase A chain
VNTASIAQYVVFLLLVTALVPPAGAYMERVFSGQHTWLDRVLRPLERAIYRVTGVDPACVMDWREYATCFVVFTLLGMLLLFGILLVQGLLPFWDPEHLTTPITLDLAANVAVSFATTTTWQPYAGESTMSYATQMVGLAAQNFLAGAAGLAMASRSPAGWPDGVSRGWATSGLTSCARACGSCCRSRWWVACCSCGRACR